MIVNKLFQAQESLQINKNDCNSNFKIQYLSNEISLLKQKITVLEEINKKHEFFIKNTFQDATEKNEVIDQYLKHNTNIQEALKRLQDKNTHLASQLLLTRQSFTQQQKFLNQTIINYQQKIASLRQLVQLKQGYIQNNEIQNLYTIKPYLVPLQTCQQSIQFVQQKQNLYRLIIRLQTKIQSLQTKIRDLNKTSTLDQENNHSSKYLHSQQYCSTQYMNEPNQKNISQYSNMQKYKLIRNQNSKRSRFSKTCTQCTDIKVQLQRTFVKLDQMIKIVQKYKKQNKYLKIKQRILKTEFINSQELLRQKNKEQLLKKQILLNSNKENKEFSTNQDQKLDDMMDEQVNQRKNKLNENPKMQAGSSFQMQQFSMIGAKLQKANKKQFMTVGFKDLEEFQF